MLIDSLMATPSGHADDRAQAGPIVLSTRIRLARNLAGVPFPGWAKEAQRRAVLSRCLDALAQSPRMAGGLRLEMESLSDLEKQLLVERHLVSRELAACKHAAGVFISRDQTCSVMVNEEDHLRLQVMRAGFRLNPLWKAIDGLDSFLEEHLDYAFAGPLGYLTACPTNVGTGLRASVMMHLPALVLAGQMDKVIRAANQLGLVVRGWLGEGSDASGSIFQISNQQTLGETEEEIIRRVTQVLQAVIEQETFARQRMQENEPVKLRDKVGRAYGVARHGHLLSSGEAMNVLSLVRLGVDLGWLPADTRPLVDRLFIECQPGHVQVLARVEADPAARDASRAAMLRELFAPVPPPTFDPGVARA